MRTRIQKQKQLEGAETLLGCHNTILFADFTGVSTEAIERLRRAMKKAGGQLQVVKKRLMKLALRKKGISYDPMRWKTQCAALFAPGDLSGVAGQIYQFMKELAKEKKDFKVLGGYDLLGGKEITAEEFLAVAKLPSREILLARLMGAFTGPLRALMYALRERSKQLVEPS